MQFKTSLVFLQCTQKALTDQVLAKAAKVDIKIGTDRLLVTFARCLILRAAIPQQGLN